MKAYIPFDIPVSGIRDGLHQFDFEVANDFLSSFPQTPVTDGRLHVHLEFDKRPTMFVLDFLVSGTVRTTCDRCLAAIDLPIAGEHKLVIKLSEEAGPEEAEVVYMSPLVEQVNVAPYVYEFIVLSIPLVKTYDCDEEEEPICNEEMLTYLDEDHSSPEGEDRTNPIWDELKRKFESDK